MRKTLKMKKKMGLLLEIWRKECIPERWKNATIVLTAKKGDAVKYESYRGIYQLVIISKNGGSSKYLAGLRRNGIFKIKKTWREYKIPSRILFLDLSCDTLGRG